jgi:hypothetical protein
METALFVVYVTNTNTHSSSLSILVAYALEKFGKSMFEVEKCRSMFVSLLVSNYCED